jgi:hypothetical protein
MITTVIISSLVLNLVLGLMVSSLSKEKPNNKTKTIYKDRIVYRDKPVEKIIYKDKIVEKIVYKDKPVVHEFVKKEEPKVSTQRKELLDALADLKSKKKKSKKDMEILNNMKKITDALMKTALTMGISLLVGIIWFCIIRFLDPEWALTTIFMLCSVFIFSLYYKKS